MHGDVRLRSYRGSRDDIELEVIVDVRTERFEQEGTTLALEVSTHEQQAQRPVGNTATRGVRSPRIKINARGQDTDALVGHATLPQIVGSPRGPRREEGDRAPQCPLAQFQELAAGPAPGTAAVVERSKVIE